MSDYNWREGLTKDEKILHILSQSLVDAMRELDHCDPLPGALDLIEDMWEEGCKEEQEEKEETTVQEKLHPSPNRLLTVAQFSAAYPEFPQSSLRSWIYYSESNGFDSVVTRLGPRKIRIGERNFFTWLNGVQGPKG